ncbi:unnamed protein product [Mytilus edulis]|uniref:Uncharacterized protein n=1 Tax=Mytilus edulis TaxID=6550 RepID=A0A8S3SW18_MYTED|nr:unnamed protein product [Mytilus edulis]
MTALTKAAENGHYTIVEQLVAKQAALNIRTHQDETALMIACRKGHFNVVSILIKCLNECINNRYISKDSECFSLENENWITFKQLPYAFCSLPVTFTNDERNQAFLNAYHNKHIDIMKLLLDNGATVNLLLNNGKNYKLTQFRKSLTLLNVAVLNREYEIVNILLNNGAQVQKRANYGIPPLMLASRSCSKHINIVKILLKHGSNINSTSEYIPIYITLLEYIWIRQNSNKSKIIRKYENPDKNGTALICAVQSSCLKLIEALVQERNVDINSQTSMGRTALMIACGTVGREKQ